MQIVITDVTLTDGSVVSDVHLSIGKGDERQQITFPATTRANATVFADKLAQLAREYTNATPEVFDARTATVDEVGIVVQP